MLNVETGAGSITSDSYQSVVGFQAYADARGFDYSAFSTTQMEQALRRATAFIDATYRNQFTGLRTNRRNQALEWPRSGAFVRNPDENVIYAQGLSDALANYDFLDTNIVPVEVVNATSEGAMRELTAPNSLAPDLDRGNALKMIKAGTVAIEYASGASPVTTFQSIDNALASLLTPMSPYSGKVARG